MDEFFPKDVRSSAQGLFNVLILGIGPFVANFVCGRLKTAYTTDDVLNYTGVFQYSMAAGLVGAVILAVFFHPRSSVGPGAGLQPGRGGCTAGAVDGEPPGVSRRREAARR